jgi:hypothetical protein
MRRMERDASWRIISDYIGAGRFVLTSDEAIVGTEYGVECVSRKPNGGDGWKVDFGSRCIGVRQFPNGSILASCRGGLLLLREDGEELREKVFADQLVHEAVPLDASATPEAGIVVASGMTVSLYRKWEPVWRYPLHEALGSSVDSARIVDIFAIENHVVVGAVDYDSGVGRVVVIGPDGKPRWLSEPGPLSEVFRASVSSFVWCLTGYGKFETHCHGIDGKHRWSLDGAGVGSMKAGGSLALITGSNESPEWDHWKVRQIDSEGRVEFTLDARGRVPVRPYCHDDGAIYFVSYVLHIDPTSSRVDYTNFFAMPQELRYQHLVGLRKQIPEYEIFVQEAIPGRRNVEIIHEIQGSYSLSAPFVFGSDVVFCDGPDIVGVER